MTLNDVTPPQRIIDEHTWQILIEFDLSLEPGRERLAGERVIEAIQRLNWPATHLERLKLALARATQNALERSSLSGSKTSLRIKVLVAEETAQPAGRSTSHGWGFFLVQKQQDNPPAPAGEQHDVIELFLYQERKHSRK